MKNTALTLVALALALTSACGSGSDTKGSSSSRPTATEISKSLTSTATGQTAKLTKIQADCAAKLLAKSDLTDKALKALIAQSTAYKPSTADTKALTAVGKTISTNCA